MIPKIIHYCWFGGKPMPREARRCIESWRKHCPDYEIIRWDESNFDVKDHPFCCAAHGAKAWAFVSDYARLKIVHDDGGIYLDTDVEILRSLDDLLNCEAFFGIQQTVFQCNTGLGFGAVKDSEAVCMMLEEYDNAVFDAAKTKKIACPYLNHKALQRLGYEYKDEIVDIHGVEVYPPRYFDPCAPGDGAENLLREETFSIHHYSNSWGTQGERIRRRLIKTIGYSRVSKIKEVIRDLKRN